MTNYQHRAYKSQQSKMAARNALVEKNYALVKKIAFRICNRLPGQVDVNDLISAGVMGLIDAAEKFDPNRHKKFPTYAEFRIKGAILDELRALDSLPRTTRSKANKLKKARDKLAQELGREPDVEELAKSMKISLKEFHKLSDETNSYIFMNSDDIGLKEEGKMAKWSQLLGQDELPEQLTHLMLDDAIDNLSSAIEKLPQKLKTVIGLYYVEELNFKEIGRVLECTESRVCQLHREAVINLKNKITTHEAQ